MEDRIFMMKLMALFTEITLKVTI